MYLLLSVAGHLTIFLARTRGPFWSVRPAKVLWIAVLGTQILATFIACMGFFMQPLGWKWAGFVWLYAIVWFLITDRIKLIGYGLLGNSNAKLAPKVNTTVKPNSAAPVPT
jgi:H+-transporting ATPase